VETLTSKICSCEIVTNLTNNLFSSEVRGGAEHNKERNQQEEKENQNTLKKIQKPSALS